LGTNRTVKIKSALTMRPGKFVITFSEAPIRCAIASAISGIATKVTAPIMTPPRVFMPERTAPVARAKERVSGKAPGETVLMVIESRAPARPANPALIVKARIFVRAMWIPANSAATL
jgi:hypothetical protein